MDKLKRIGVTFIESNSEFEKALNKACYAGDEGEVKDKHMAVIKDCFAGKNKETIDPAESLRIFLGKHIEFEHDFRRNMKSLHVLHRSLESIDSSDQVASWLIVLNNTLQGNSFIP